MIDRLEKFHAPKHPSDLIYGLILLAFVLVAVFIPAPKSESVTKAEAPRGVSTTLPKLAYPLGCPEEDAKGRKLKGTVSIIGERHVRCYYGS